MSSNPNIIAFIGPTGVGKTTIGKLLAQNLNYVFVDLDKLIEDKLGVDIDWIFQLEGESGFRKYESDTLIQLLTNTQENTVLSTGGGAILLKANQTLLKAKAKLIYLSASLETLLERTTQTKGRPLLSGNDRKTRLQQILNDRQGIYQELADFSLRVDKLNMYSIVNAIEDYLKQLPDDKG